MRRFLTMPNGLELIKCKSEVTPLVTNTELSLSATVFEVGGEAPTSIIRADQAWYVIVRWSIKGHLVQHLCGKWHVSVSLESIGPGEEYEFPTPPKVVEMKPCGDGTYETQIDIAAGQVAFNDVNGTSYIVSVGLGSTDPCGNAGHLYGSCRGDVGQELRFVPGPPHEPL
jgi:hypothetical protein